MDPIPKSCFAEGRSQICALKKLFVFDEAMPVRYCRCEDDHCFERSDRCVSIDLDAEGYPVTAQRRLAKENAGTVRDIDTREWFSVKPDGDRAQLVPVLLVHAAIYEWCLDRIEPEHPLFHISYFGQVVRSGVSAQEAVDARTKEHMRASARNPKDLGLHWAIGAFGVDAFTVRVVEIARLPRLQAMAWADARERALIAEHGGVMRDREPDAPVRQTLNLTNGGQGDPRMIWQSIDGMSQFVNVVGE